MEKDHKITSKNNPGTSKINNNNNNKCWTCSLFNREADFMNFVLDTLLTL